MANIPDRDAKPWDLVNPTITWAPEEVAQNRMSICKECPSYLLLTHQCKECGCLMNAKTKMPHATCPLGKWGKFLTEEENND